MTAARYAYDPFALHEPANGTEREIRRLVLAAVDMQMAAHAADVQLSGEAPGLGRLLETAMVVCYARPFTAQGIGQLGQKWAPKDPEERALHDSLLDQRNKRYAHTDVGEFRGMVNIGLIFGEERPLFAESWKAELWESPAGRDELERVSALCRHQWERFTDRVRALEQSLRPNDPAEYEEWAHPRRSA